MRVRKKNTYCFDLDGTLCTQVDLENYGANADPDRVFELAEPYNKRIMSVNALYDNGHTIYIDTARGTDHNTQQLQEWYDMTKKQLDIWGVKYHRLRVGHKLIADYYIDDRGRQDIEWFTRI
jgi:phosphoserine phosphatase